MPPATAGAAAAQVRARLLAFLAPIVADAGFDLEDITVTAAGRRSMVRLIVDGDGGIDLAAIATVSRTVSDALDSDAGSHLLPSAYVLEVSSPGVDRPLTEARHWRRAVGRLVTVPIDGAPTTGRIVDADDDGVVLDVQSTQRTAGWPSLGAARVQVEFNRGVPDDDVDDDDDDDDDVDDDVDVDEIDEPEGS